MVSRPPTYGLVRLLFLVLPAIVLLGCSGPTEVTRERGEAPSYLDRPDAARFAATEPTTVVFRSEDEWQTFWLENNQEPLGTPAPSSAVDFKHQMLVGIFWGRQSGCLSGPSSRSRVKSVERRGDDLEIVLDSQQGFGLCRATGYPQQIIEVDRVPGSVELIGALPGRP